MARRKKPENETPVEERVRRIKESISNHANRSEKVSWNRKMDNMVKLHAKLRPIEQKIITIMAEEKFPVLDDIQELRLIMVKECVHPYEHLVIQLDHVECRFCNKKLATPLEFITPEDEMIRTCDAEEENTQA